MSDRGKGDPHLFSTVGYVQHIDLNTLQSCVALDCRVTVTALPGAFVSTHCPLLCIEGFGEECYEGGKAFRPDAFSDAFTIGSNRTFQDDPRFGLLALSEIADKALSLQEDIDAVSRAAEFSSPL